WFFLKDTEHRILKELPGFKFGLSRAARYFEIEVRQSAVEDFRKRPIHLTGLEVKFINVWKTRTSETMNVLTEKELFFDFSGKLAILRLHGAFESGHGLARSVDKIFVKVPTRRFPGLGGEFLK